MDNANFDDNRDQANTQLQKALDLTKHRAFMPEYQNTVDTTEVMGTLIANYFEWDGLQILQALAYGLEDANFHKESEQVREIAQKIIDGDKVPVYVNNLNVVVEG